MIQGLIDRLYRNPRSYLNRISRFGGYFKYQEMLRNNKLMEEASRSLPPAESFSDGLPVYFLTGQHYFYQTLFCIRSLTAATPARFLFKLVDDGTFNRQLIQRIQGQVRGAEIIDRQVIGQMLDDVLPETSFPGLRKKRLIYPHIKKLTDIHILNGTDWKLVLDSDMLFYNSPEKLLSWLERPDRPIHMADCVESYGYSKNLMEKLSGGKVPSLLNVGAIGLKSSAINWRDIEHWVETLEAAEGKTYYLEQALSAMVIGRSATTLLDPADYIVNPDESSVLMARGILHHYVDLSKRDYYNKAWKRFL